MHGPGRVYATPVHRICSRVHLGEFEPIHAGLHVHDESCSYKPQALALLKNTTARQPVGAWSLYFSAVLDVM